MNRETLSLLQRLSTRSKQEAARETARLVRRVEEGRRQEAILSQYADNLANRLLDAAREGCVASALQAMQEFGDALRRVMASHAQTLPHMDRALSSSLERLQAARASERMVGLLVNRSEAAREQREAKAQDAVAASMTTHRLGRGQR